MAQCNMDNKKEVESLLLVQAPDKRVYLTGETTLDLSGGQICVVYDDGSFEQVEMGKEGQIGTLCTDKAGPALAKVEFCGQELLYQVQVKEPEIRRFVIVSPPNKTEYLAGERLDLSGLNLKVIYENGEERAWKDIPQVEHTVEMGEAVYSLNIKNISIPIFIKVMAAKIVSLDIGSMPTKTDYLERAEKLDVSGGTVLIVYDSGKKEEVPMTLSMVRGFSNLTPGPQTLSVQIGPNSTTFKVNIQAKKAKRLSVLTEPLQTSYVEGENIVLDGLKLQVAYDNGESRIIEGQLPENNNLPNDEIFGYEPSVASLETMCIQINVGMASTQVPISVTPRQITAIKITKHPQKTQYLEKKEEFDPTGAELTCSYNYGNDVAIPVTRDMVFGFDNRVAGECKLEVQYCGLATTLCVEIIPAQLLGIMVSKIPDRTTYAPGEMFDTTGMSISGFYSNGIMQPIRAYLVTPNRPLQRGDIAIVVTNLDKSAIVPISVDEQYAIQDASFSETEPVEVFTNNHEPMSVETAESEPEKELPKNEHCNHKGKKNFFGRLGKSFYPSSSRLRDLDE